MAFVASKTLHILTGLSVVALLAIGGFIWSGFYDVGADTPPTGPVTRTPDHPHAPASGSAPEPPAHPPGTPPHDDTPADSDPHAGLDHAPQRIGDAKSNATQDYPPPGTRADRHAPAAAEPPSVPVAEPEPKQEEPSLPPESHDDGHKHQH